MKCELIKEKAFYYRIFFMEKEKIRVVRIQPSDYKGLLDFCAVSSSYKQSVARSPPTGIRGGGGSYFHL